MKQFVFSFFLIISVSVFSQSPPTAVNDTAIAYRGHVIVNVLQNDFDTNGDPIWIISCNQPHNGEAFKLNDSLIEYMAYPSFHGSDSLRYVIQDTILHQLTATGTLFLTVTSLMFDSVDVNNINAGICANGVLFNEMMPDYKVAFEVPKGSEKNTVFSGAMWIAGLDSSDILHVAAERYEQVGHDFWPGPTSNVYDTAYDNKFKRLWKISKPEIDYHLAHFWQSGYVPVQTLIDWPCNGDTALGQSAVLAPFKDWNNDGIYDPYAGDYPLIKGDEADYFIFNDDRELHTESGGNKLGIEVHGMAYEFNCPDDSALWNTMFVNYKIFNHSQNTYHETYIGIFPDMDIGDAMDDYIGCDVQRGSFYSYNGDNLDGTGITSSYGSFPPAQSITFLAGPFMDPDGIDNPSGLCDDGINGFNFGNGIPDDERMGLNTFIILNSYTGVQGDPVIPIDYYNYLQGNWKDSTKMLWAGSCGPECNFMFPGDTDPCNWGTSGLTPNCTPFWTEQIMGDQPGDRRGIGSTGPFTFEAGSTEEFDIAFVFGRDYVDSSAIAGISVMQQRIDSIRKYFVNDSTPCGLGFSEITHQPEIVPQINIYPNPANNFVIVETSGMKSEMNYEIFDIVGRKIKLGKLNPSFKNSVDVSGLDNGLYILNISDGTNKISRKFLKQ